MFVTTALTIFIYFFSKVSNQNFPHSNLSLPSPIISPGEKSASSSYLSSDQVILEKKKGLPISLLQDEQAQLT